MNGTFYRIFAVLVKEFTQLRRDRLTFAMMFGVPLMQLCLFGFAINSDPKDLPAALVCADPSVFSRSIVRSMENTGYFKITHTFQSEAEAEQLMDRGDIQFIIVIPTDFSRRLQRGEHPALLVASDASDPVASSGALAALSGVGRQALAADLKGPLANLQSSAEPFEIRVHRRYNPEGLTRFNIVPGLLGVILTFSLIQMTALSMTRERERGTMENLLATPVKPVEVLIGKILPNVLIGYVQVGVVINAARWLFGVPVVGGLGILLVAAGLFIASNLAAGFVFSTMAQNQMQAMQMTFLFALPNMLLSGFMFPFRGMPVWAQTIGEMLPLTHFLRVVRAILLKGVGWRELGPQLWPIIVFLLLSCTLAVRRYRRTLD